MSRTLSSIVTSTGESSFPDRQAEVGDEAQQLVDWYDSMDEELQDGALARKRRFSYVSPTRCKEAKTTLTENLQTKPKKVNNNRISAHPLIPPGIQYEIPVVGFFQARNYDPEQVCVCHIHCRVHWRAGRRPGLCRSTSALRLIGSTIREFSIGSALWVSEVLCCLY